MMDMQVLMVKVMMGMVMIFTAHVSQDDDMGYTKDVNEFS